MKFYHLIIWISYAVFHIHSEFVEDFALVVLKTEREYKFAEPVLRNVASTIIGYEMNETLSKTFFMCPKSKAVPSNENALYIKTWVEDEPANLQKICKKSLQPEIFTLRQQNKHINVHHVGYQIYVDNPKLIRFPEYEEIDENFYFMPIIAIYRDTFSDHTIAVKYRMTETFLLDQPENTNLSRYKDHSLFPSHLKQFFRYQGTYFKEKFLINYHTYYHVLNRFLIEVPLVNENDFVLETFKKTVRYNVNLTSMWTQFERLWKKVEQFVRDLVLAIGPLTITTGVGKVLTVDDFGHLHQLEWREYDKNIFVPELFWKAIEYEFGVEKKGLFMIMHHDPFKNANEQQKICEENICIKNRIWNTLSYYDIVQDLVYCCEMNTETIQKLEAEFLFRSKPSLSIADVKSPIYFPSTIF